MPELAGCPLARVDAGHELQRCPKVPSDMSCVHRSADRGGEDEPCVLPGGAGLRSLFRLELQLQAKG